MLEILEFSRIQNMDVITLQSSVIFDLFNEHNIDFGIKLSILFIHVFYYEFYTH